MGLFGKIAQKVTEDMRATREANEHYDKLVERAKNVKRIQKGQKGK